MDKENIKLFNVFRKNDLNLAVAVSDKEGESDLYFYHEKSALNTLSKKNADFQKANITSIKKLKLKQLIKLLKILHIVTKKLIFCL